MWPLLCRRRPDFILSEVEGLPHTFACSTIGPCHVSALQSAVHCERFLSGLQMELLDSRSWKESTTPASFMSRVPWNKPMPFSRTFWNLIRTVTLLMPNTRRKEQHNSS